MGVLYFAKVHNVNIQNCQDLEVKNGIVYSHMGRKNIPYKSLKKVLVQKFVTDI